MGGRGNSSGLSQQTMSLDEYLGTKGLSSPISDFMDDKMRIPHGLTQRQKKQLEKEASVARNEYAEKRQAAIAEYNSKVESGQIKQPSRIDSLVRQAHGHSDNPSVQAARKALEKRGIDWRTGKKKRK